MDNRAGKKYTKKEYNKADERLSEVQTRQTQNKND